MDTKMSKFTADLLQSVREMNADVGAIETKKNIKVSQPDNQSSLLIS